MMMMMSGLQEPAHAMPRGAADPAIGARSVVVR